MTTDDERPLDLRRVPTKPSPWDDYVATILRTHQRRIHDLDQDLRDLRATVYALSTLILFIGTLSLLLP